MSWRFRKSFSPFPGVRLTLSPGGITTSVGVGPFRVSSGPRGAAFTANAPGTGLAYRKSLASQASQEVSPSDQDSGDISLPSGSTVEQLTTVEMKEIKSVGSGVMTSAGLREFGRLLEDARREHAAITGELAAARQLEHVAVSKYENWERGWLLRRMFKQVFERHQSTAQEATARRLELEEQERLSRLSTQLEMPAAVEATFHRLCDEFAVLANAGSIWDTVGERETNKVVERTTATRRVERKQVAFRLGSCELITSGWKVPHLENANGGDIYLYPTFILYFINRERFALLEYREAELVSHPVGFLEEESLPADAKVIEYTWAKTNRNGSPDKRFKDNYQIPVLRYGTLSLRSSSGMNEEYMASNCESVQAFGSAWQSHVGAVKAGA